MESHSPKLLLRTLAIAIILHLFILLGFGFSIQGPLPESHTPRVLEFALTHSENQQKPEKADFIGQADQLGGGHHEKAFLPKQANILPDNFHPESFRQSNAEITHNLDENIRNTQRVETMTTNTQKAATDDASQPAQAKLKAQQLMQLSQELLAYRSRQDLFDEFRTKRPRRRTISAAVHESRDALYLDAWQRKIERIGNINYPRQAKLRKIYGSLLLLVALKADGSLERMEIKRSSGYPLLDESAKAIVKLAAPFSPFPKEIKRDTDILEIIRTWYFRKNNRFETL